MKICTRIANNEQQKYLSLCDFCNLRDNSCPECESCNIPTGQNNNDVMCKQFISKITFENIRNYVIFDWYKNTSSYSFSPNHDPYLVIYLYTYEEHRNYMLYPVLVKIILNVCSNNIIESKKYSLKNFVMSNSSYFTFYSAVETPLYTHVLVDIRGSENYPEESTYLLSINKQTNILLFNHVGYLLDIYSINKKIKMVYERNLLFFHVSYDSMYINNVMCIIKLNENNQNPVSSITHIKSVNNI